MLIHFFLVSDRLPYLGYLSIKSAYVVQKPEKIYLWHVPILKCSYKDYIDKVTDFVEMKDISSVFVPTVGTYEAFKKGVSNRCGEKDKLTTSTMFLDIVSYWILSVYGGTRLDLDAVSLGNIGHYFPTDDRVRVFEHIGYLPNENRLINGFYNTACLMAKSGSHINDIFSAAAAKWKVSSHLQYDSFGPLHLYELAAQHPDWFVVEPEECICDVPTIVQGKIVNPCQSDGYIWDRALIVHIHAAGKYDALEEENIAGSALLQRMDALGILSNMPDEHISSNESSGTINPDVSIVPDVPDVPIATFSGKTKYDRKRFHLLGVPNLPTNKTYSLSCAFTQKALKLAKILKTILGHEVLFYGIETSEVDCDEFIQVSTMDELEAAYGKRFDRNVYYDVRLDKPVIELIYNRTIEEINKRKNSTDFLLCPYGIGNRVVANAVALPFTVETGIGYIGFFAPFRVFESSAWMHYNYGRFGVEDMYNYDIVIPNYFDTNDFTFSAEKEDFMLFLGRLIYRKGLEVAVQLANETKTQLLVAGQYCGEFTFDAINARSYCKAVGFADYERRKELLSKAMLLICPTLFIAPFEGVHIEANFSGTPVVTSDNGVFMETVIQGKTGYRCRVFGQYVEAINRIKAGEIDPYYCRNYAVNNFSLERIAMMYDEYFAMIYDLRDKGYYTRREFDMSWLNKYYE